MDKVNTSIMKLYMVPLLVVLVILLLVPFVLLPQLQTIRDKNLEVRIGQERLDSINSKLKILGSIDEEEERLKLLEMEKLIPSSKELASLVVGVRSLASKSDLSVVAMELSPGRVATSSATTSSSKKSKAFAAREKKEDSEKITFELTLKSKKVSNLQKFLTAIQKAKRLLGVETIDIRRDEKGVYTFVLEIIAPVRELRSSGDVVASPLPVLTDSHKRVFDFVADFINFTNVTIQKVKTGVKDPFK